MKRWAMLIVAVLLIGSTVVTCWFGFNNSAFETTFYQVRSEKVISNIRIVQTAIKRLKLPEDKFYVNIADYGNISSSCIPLALSQLHDQGRLHEGMKLCFVGFGAGLVYAATIVEL